MTLIIDNRPQLGVAPGLHALIVGVSRYQYLPERDAGQAGPFGMRQLSACARSANSVAEWLIANDRHLPARLATCRMLLSPSAAEAATLAHVHVAAATMTAFLEAVRDWREDASQSRDDVAFLYFAGHGIQRTRDNSIILFEDFGDGIGGLLRNAVDVKSVFYGMAPSNQRPDISRRQFYFVDACREFPPEQLQFANQQATPAFDTSWPTYDDRAAPIFFAALPGASAYSLPGRSTLFSEALLKALSGGAGEPTDDAGRVRWRVSVGSLIPALKAYLEEMSRAYGEMQGVSAGGAVDVNTVVTYLPTVPDVNVVIEIVPAESVAEAVVTVPNDAGTNVPVPAPLNPHPYSSVWLAGYYRIGATFVPRGVKLPTATERVWPPLFHKRIFEP